VLAEHPPELLEPAVGGGAVVLGPPPHHVEHLVAALYGLGQVVPLRAPLKRGLLLGVPLGVLPYLRLENAERDAQPAERHRHADYRKQ